MVRASLQQTRPAHGLQDGQVALDLFPHASEACNAVTPRKTLSFLAALGLVLPHLSAQDTRSESAARTSDALSRTHQIQAPSRTSEAEVEAESDFGEQKPLEAKGGGIGAYLIGDSSLNYTSNPSLRKNGGQGDMFFVARGGAGLHPNLVGGLYLDAHVLDEVFQYAHFSSLNFNHLNAGGGLDYIFEDLGQLTAFVHYEFDRYTSGDDCSQFYLNNSIVTGLSKEFHLNDVMAIQAGWQSSFSVTAIPSYSRRDEHDFWVGWHWRFVEPLELQTYYIFSLYNYPGTSRVDATNNVGASLTYNITPWAKLAVSASFGANNSTESTFDYTVVNVGGLVGLDFRF